MMRLGQGGASAWSVRARAALIAALAFAVACSEGQPPTAPTPGPPALACPPNVAQSGVVGGSQNVTYATPIAVGGAAPVSTTCTPASGSGFPMGTTMVTCTATDAQSRQATCSFSVALRPLTLTVQRFVAFGDSVTAGEDGRRLQIRFGFVDPLNAYPTLLQSILERDFPDQGIFVANEGLGGRRARDDERRLPTVLETYQAQAVLLLHGYNDLLNDGVRAVDTVVSALRTMVRDSRGRGVHAFLSTITPSRPHVGRFDRTIEPQAIQQTNTKLIAMAREEGAYLVDAFAAFSGRELELVEDDGLHLTAAGNQVLADTFYATIRSAGFASQSLIPHP
jgi:lysophospholipase L1-like esterase